MSLKRLILNLRVLLVTACLCSSSGAQQIYYSGKLFGYYRIEKGEVDHLNPVNAFLQWHNSTPGAWLLGMGDNYGPEFGASIQFRGSDEDCLFSGSRHQATSPKPQARYPRALYKDDQRLPASAGCDNVTNFLMTAGYRAVVPGREDFIYSSYWLRTIARSLQSINAAAAAESVNNPDHRLSMLAANLRLTRNGGDGVGKRDSPTCGLLFAPDPLGSDGALCTASGDSTEAFDWLDRLDKIMMQPTQDAIRSLLIGARAPTRTLDPDAIRTTIVKNQLLILQAAWGRPCNLEMDRVLGKDAIEKLHEWNDVKAWFSNSPQIALANVCSGANAQTKNDFNTYWNDLKKKLDAVFNRESDEPAFANLLVSSIAATAAQHELLLAIDSEMLEAGYTIAGPGSDRILIVGIVGKETMSAVSTSNLQVCTDDKGNAAACSISLRPKAATVTVFDPVSAVVTSIRAAVRAHGSFSKVIVMAQMPAPEADVLAARVRSRVSQIKHSAMPGQMVDAVISEAQLEYQSSTVTLEKVDPELMTPVFTPRSPDFSEPNLVMPGSLEHLTIGVTDSGNEYVNERLPEARFERQSNDDQSPLTAASQLGQRIPGNARKWVPCLKPTQTHPQPDCKYETELAVLDSLQRADHGSDVVLLQRRDLYFDELPVGYEGKNDAQYCLGTVQERSDCMLRVALDRVLWKGDYMEHVALTGSDLSKILDTSSALALGENDLKATDLSQQWLVTYGITQAGLNNLSLLSNDGEPLWIPADPECKQADQSKASKSLYCVNGRPIVPDEVYWIAASDSLAEDKIVYSQLGASAPQHRKLTDKFLTEVAAVSLGEIGGEHEAVTSDARAITSLGAEFQQQPLFQLDYNKLVLGFSNSHSLGSTDQVPSQLQGVADSRAAVPHTQDTDLEATLRLTRDHAYFQSVALGTLTSFVYERSIKGNLTGAPETVSYLQNLATFGGFAQFTLRRDYGIRSRSVPRDLIVITPHQFQTQVNNSRLFIAYTAKDGAGLPIPGQLSLALPLVQSFNDKMGNRYEWGNRPQKSWNVDGGSYAEGGFEFSVQNNILSSITLANGAIQHTCSAAANMDIGSCFKNLKSTFPIGPNTILVGNPASATLHSPGAYWDVHLSRKLDMGALRKMKTPFALVSDSIGDVYFGRPASAVLPTQTNFAITWNSAVTFPIWGNLTVAPTYSAFFYRPQLSNTYEQIRAFSISLRWYLGRNERTPIPQQLQFVGPTSADQTKAVGKSK